MKFSIIVPIYNVEQYLIKCIDSILCQKETDYELILVDDGSPDNSFEICDKYEEKYSQIKVIHKQNEGLVSARKAGLEHAQGEYILFVDADDWVDNRYLEVIDELTKEHKADIICFGYSLSNKEKYCRQIIETGYYSSEKIKSVIIPNMISSGDYYQFGIGPSIWSKCVKKDILMKLYPMVPNDITLGEDVAITYLILCNVSSVYISDACIYNYRINNNSMTHSYNLKLKQQVLNLFEHLKKSIMPYDKSLENQILEYESYILSNVFVNEISCSTISYRKIRKNIKIFVSNPTINCVLNGDFKRKLPLRYKIMLFLARNKMYYTLIIIYKIFKKDF